MEKDTLLDNFKLKELPVLSVKFIELLELLVCLFNFCTGMSIETKHFPVVPSR